MILCDIGNTTFHFKVKNQSFVLPTHKSLKHLPSYSEPIYYISVNSKATKVFLKKYPDAINIENIIRFETSYQGMGIDRKVVCKYIKDGIIVDFGSAITVDIMKNGIHKGGFILPGIKAFKSIYPNISQKLSFHFEKNTNLDKIPLTTNDAINYAILNAISLPILKEYEKYQIKVYFTGGDKSLLKKHFENIPVKYMKNMMFKSMKKIIQQSNKKKKGK